MRTGGEDGANYWAPLTRKRHAMPHSAQPQHTNDWAPRTRKRHQQEHRPQRPTESSDPTQHAKGRTGDCPGPCKGAATRRNVTQGGARGLRLSLSSSPSPISKPHRFGGPQGQGWGLQSTLKRRTCVVPRRVTFHNRTAKPDTPVLSLGT